MPLPDPDAPFPIRLPDGSTHKGTVHLSQVITNPRFDVGDYTYASDFDPPEDPADWSSRLAPFLFPSQPERLVIGRFCQIAHGTRFITSSANHAKDGASTYPFPVFDTATIADYHPDTRDTIIGHDVWFGYGAMVLPGARIGNGAIIGAGAVVRGAVPDYAIVTGNPAEVLRLRFPPDTIVALNRLAWWDWPSDKIAAQWQTITNPDIASLLALADQGA